MFDHKRRRLLQSLSMVTAGSLLQKTGSASPIGFNHSPFTLGVAGGSPSKDGFVLWTRLVSDELHALNAVEVRWEVFEDGAPHVVVASGIAPAIAALAFSVHVEVSGLRPDRWFGYRFTAGGIESPNGRSRTLPLPDAAASSLRFAYASCQRGEDGFYAAYRHMLTESLEFVVFLGDYIYEYPCRSDSVARRHDLQEANTLAHYRDRYALYKSDQDLQRMHAACPWLITWDDHEVENDYTALPSNELFTERRLAAYQAFYEHMPLRRATLVHGLAGLGSPGGLRIYDRIDFGKLARFHILDTRQYRDLPACRDKTRGGSDARPRKWRVDCTMLGLDQETWLARGFKQSTRRQVQWNVIAQQSVFTPRNYRHGRGSKASPDIWDGYPEARDRLLTAIGTYRLKNPVFLGGDIHQNWVANVHQDPYDISSPIIASEFCGTQHLIENSRCIFRPGPACRSEQSALRAGRRRTPGLRRGGNHARKCNRAASHG